MCSPLPPPRRLETLDDLFAQAAHYAEFCLRNSGRMAPTLFLIGADGLLMFVPGSLANETEKDDFATTARLICLAQAATVVVMALESWLKTATPGEKLDLTEPPSEAFDRQEVIALMGESRDGQKAKFLPIIRSGNGKFFGLGESNTPSMDTMTGRFAQILPPTPASAEHRRLAQAMLKVKNVKAAILGSTVRLPRSRR
ncbi:MAG: hypothetical protein ACYDH9_21180 [Limisphaerales bacterium]